jgi:hypothetical protein
MSFTWRQNFDAHPVGTYVLMLQDSEVKVEGSIKTYVDRKTDSGVLLDRVFCENCGTSVYLDLQNSEFQKCQLTRSFPARSIPKRHFMRDSRVSIAGYSFFAREVRADGKILLASSKS